MGGRKIISIMLVIITVVSLVQLPTSVVSSSSSTLLYTIAHISDVQDLSQYYPSTLNYTFQWIENRKNDLNIIAIVITGDLVNTYNDVSQWQNYLKAKSLTTIPVYEVAGNHDSNYGQDFTYYEQYIGSNETFYVTAISEHFMLVGISWNGTDNMITEDMVSKFRAAIRYNPDKYFIIATHYYMDENAVLSPLGQLIYDELYLNYTRNVAMVLCGHVHTRLSNVRNGLHEYITNIQGADQSYVRLFKVYSNFTVVMELWRLKPTPEELVETQKFTLPQLSWRFDIGGKGVWYVYDGATIHDYSDVIGNKALVSANVGNLLVLTDDYQEYIYKYDNGSLAELLENDVGYLRSIHYLEWYGKWLIGNANPDYPPLVWFDGSNVTPAFATHQRIYIVGGWNDDVGGEERVFEVFDTINGTWYRLPDAPSAFDGGGSYGPLIAMNGKLYFINSSKYIWEYNPEDGEWRPLSKRPVDAGFAMFTVYKGRIYIFGGQIGETSVDDVDIYDPVEDRWYKSALPEVRDEGVAVPTPTGIFVIGGEITPSQVKTTNWFFDPETTSITSKAPMPFAGEGMGAAYTGGYIYMFGGESDGTVYNYAYRYNVETNTWEALANLPDTRNHMVVVALSGKLYIIAGCKGAPYWYSQTWRYDPATNSYETLPSVSVARGRLQGAAYNPRITSIASRDGREILVGGASLLDFIDREGNIYHLEDEIGWKTVTAIDYWVSRGVYVIGTINGFLYEFNPDTKEIAKLTGVEMDEITHLVVNQEHGYLVVVGYVSGAQKIYVFDGTTWIDKTAQVDVGTIRSVTYGVGKVLIAGDNGVVEVTDWSEVKPIVTAPVLSVKFVPAQTPLKMQPSPPPPAPPKK